MVRVIGVLRLLLVGCLGLTACTNTSPPTNDAVAVECLRAAQDQAVVPDVVGLSLFEAIDDIQDAGLAVVGTGVPGKDPSTDSATVYAQEPPAGISVPRGACVGMRTTGLYDVSRRIEGLENVETSVFALESVWAVTSNRSDRFSREPIDAGVVRIDPMTGDVEHLLDSPGVEPTLRELDDKLWVSLHDKIVALDASGSVVATIPLETDAPSDVAIGGGHLWVPNFAEGSVSIIDPSDASVVRTVETGDFPVSPLSAFGHVWVPSSIDGTVTIIDEQTLGDSTTRTTFVSPQQLEDVTAVPDALTGDEVWVTSRNGEVFAITASGADLGQVRQVGIENAINRVHIDAGRAFLLPIAGRDVFVLDVQTDALIARIATGSIPFRALVAHGLVWVTGDGIAEIVSVIDPESASLRAQFQVGSNQSNTNGPHTPLAVGDQIWIPNRGDSTFFIIETSHPALQPDA